MKIKHVGEGIKWNLRYILLIPALLVLFLLSVFLYRIFSVHSPQIEGVDSLKMLPATKEVYLMVENNFPVKSVLITFKQAEKEFIILDDKPDVNHKEYKLSIKPKEAGLSDGDITVTIRARSGLFKKTEIVVDAKVDTVPPVVSVLSDTYITSQGSAASVLANADGADEVYVEAGGKRYKATAGVDGQKSHYFVIYPIERYLPIKEPIQVVAVDSVGNKSQTTVKTIINPTKYRKDSIKIGDDFMNQKIYPLLGKTPQDIKQLDAFLEVNEKWRVADDEKVKEIARKSVEKLLWKDRFIQMKNSKVFATFGDERDYIYEDKVVSHSIHLGYDLASLSNSPVEASNNGIVVFTGTIGIYGNTVIIDHGLNLMSLYGHLTSIEVKVGQEVTKGQKIALSGQTGLAVGDHLHFGILCHGVFVSPVPWWDKSWIDKRILKVLEMK
ncbi:MAG: peptidoglycan DD-metalloendopeptidase family protein [Candidatus Magnetoovum sp. WYHC-5]|nr:peptidoglycan DD-metalloendopeptidase family protein [Candidatus Magnetoovum sp. WYHC-5]